MLASKRCWHQKDGGIKKTGAPKYTASIGCGLSKARNSISRTVPLTVKNRPSLTITANS